jgi:hypothetical protein
MRKTKGGFFIELTRADLLLFRKHLDIRCIDLNCFSIRAVSKEELELADCVVFKDDDGIIAVLKDRGISPSLDFEFEFD